MSSPACTFEGNTDMYGLGIRLAFYLQWYGTIAAPWLARSEVSGLNLSNTVFIAATFLALLIQTVRNHLRPVEIYIILLLCFGGYLYFVPLYAWRLLIRCDPRWDPSRWPRTRISGVSSIMNFFLLVAVSGFQLWFWFVGVESLDINDDGCREWGFLFTRIELTNKVFVVLNIVFQFLLLLCCIGILCIAAGKAAGIWDEREYDRLPKFVCPKAQILVLQRLQSLTNIIIATTVLTATELTIHWNAITGVDSLSSAGQLIPFVIGISLVVRVLYVRFFKDEEEGLSGSGSQVDGHQNGGGGDGDKGLAGVDEFIGRSRIPAPAPVDRFVVIEGRRARSRSHGR